MSTTPATCTDNIIGLSQTECPCNNYDKPADFDESTSGLYLDQLDGISLDLISSVEDCEQGGLWDIMARARNNAIMQTNTDVLAKMAEYYQYARQPFEGAIGEQKASTDYTRTAAYNGLRIIAAPIRDGKITIKRLGFLYNGADQVTFTIYNNISDDVIATGTVTTVPNKVTWYTFGVPLELPMWDLSCPYLQYFVLHTNPNQAVKPKANKILCSSCSGFYPTCGLPPKFGQGIGHAQNRWYEFVNLGFTSGSNLDDRQDWGSSSPQLNGILIDMKIECLGKNVVCNNLDFEGNPGWSMVYAYAVQFGSGINLLDRILASGSINRYTMMDRERMMGKKNSYRSEYTWRIEWLAQHIDIAKSGCYICNARMGMGGIMA